MKNIFNWISKHKTLCIIFALTAYVLPLLIIHLLFRDNTKPFFASVWTAGELLAYSVAYIGIYATIILGVSADEKERHRLSQIKPKIECYHIISIRIGNPYDNGQQQRLRYIVQLRNNSPNKIGNAYFEDVRLYNTYDDDYMIPTLELNNDGNTDNKEFDYISEKVHTITRGKGRLVAKYIYTDIEQHPYCLTFEAMCIQDSFIIWEIKQISDEPYITSAKEMES